MNNIVFILLIIFFIIILLFSLKIVFYIINFYYPMFSDIDIDCKNRRWGCCNDNITPKLDFNGSNCRGF